MAKKIKHKKEPSEEEQKVDEAQATEEAARDAAGIQDEFQARGFELVEWVHEKQGAFLGVLSAIVAAGLAFGVFTVTKRSKNLDASVALAAGLEAYDAPIVDTSEPDAKGISFPDAAARATRAHELFALAAQQHPGTGAAAIAHLYAGHTALRRGDHADATTNYEAYLKGASADDPLRFAGFSGLAAAAEARGDRKAAITHLNDLVNLPGKVSEDAALLELARLQKAEGDITAARTTLDRLAKDFPESSLKSRADELLATLGGAAPAATPTPTPSAPPAP